MYCCLVHRTVCRFYIIYKSIPYLNKNSNSKITKHLDKMTNENTKITQKPINKINQCILSNTKDKIDKSKTSNLIYNIPCNDCEKSYIGQTKQHLESRLKQHKASTKKQTKDNSDTALAKHTFDTKHTFNYDNTKILHRENNFKKRITLESLYIQKNINNAVNFKTDINNLNKAYSYNLSLIK